MRTEPEKGEENRVSDVPLSGMVVERLARVEAAIDGLRHLQNLTIGATVGIGAILAGFIIAFGIYGLQRIDALDAKLNTFDAKLNTFDAKFNTFDAKLNTVEAGIDRKIDQKFDAFAARFSEEAARNRQELIGIATAIGNAITAARPPPPGSALPPGPIGGGSSPPGPR